VTNLSSRKQFFAKLLGVSAAFGVLPKLFAKTISVPSVRPAARSASKSFELRHDVRVVARRAESV
jgi:hypothetical protein